MRLRILRLGFSQLGVQFERLVILAGPQQVLGQSALDLRVVRLEGQGAAEHLGRTGEISHLLVSGAKRGQGMLIGRLVGDSLEHFDFVLGVADIAVHHGKARQSILIIRVAFERLLESLLRLHGILRHPLQAAQRQPALQVGRIFPGDDLVLLDGLADHLLIDLALLRIADGAGVDTAQHSPRREVIRILLEHLLGFRDGRFQLVALDVQIGQLFQQIGRRRIEFQSLLVVVDRLGVVVAAISVGRRLFGIVVSHCEVIVGSRFVRCGWGLTEGGWEQNKGQKKNECFR